MNKKLVLIVLIGLYIFLKMGEGYRPIEQFDIPSSGSLDLVSYDGNEKRYRIAQATYNFLDTKDTTSRVNMSISESIGESMEDRRRQTNRIYTPSLQKIILLGESMARDGIGSIVEASFSNTKVNDSELLAVCEGEAIDILKHNIEGYSSSGDFIEGMIKNSIEGNFMGHDYKMIDMYVRIDSEGKNIVLPYIKHKDNKFQISGIALFNKDKMVKVLDNEESKIMNMLREDNVKGILTLKNSWEEYINFSGKTKRTVSVEKIDDKFIFNINLELTGNIMTNTLYGDMNGKSNKMKKFEEDMQTYVENIGGKFIEKMKTEYKIDCLQLGKEAVEKYGRNSNKDWNKVVSNSEIKLKVKVKLKGIGRGDY